MEDPAGFIPGQHLKVLTIVRSESTLIQAAVTRTTCSRCFTAWRPEHSYRVSNSPRVSLAPLTECSASLRSLTRYFIRPSRPMSFADTSRHPCSATKGATAGDFTSRLRLRWGIPVMASTSSAPRMVVGGLDQGCQGLHLAGGLLLLS